MGETHFKMVEVSTWTQPSEIWKLEFRCVRWRKFAQFQEGSLRRFHSEVVRLAERLRFRSVFDDFWNGSIPSGELTFCYGKSPCLMGKSTMSMAIFNSYVSSPEGSRLFDLWHINSKSRVWTLGYLGLGFLRWQGYQSFGPAHLVGHVQCYQE